MKKYQYLASWDDQTLTRVGEPVVVLGDSNVSQVEVTLPSNFLLDPTKAECRMYFLLPGEKESNHDVLETAVKDENGDSHVTWTIKHVHSQKGGRLAFSLTLIGDNNVQWDSRTAIIPVYESRYQPESEEAEKPYTGRLDALEGSMASIRGEFAEVQDDFEELKETATLGTPIPESLVANMQEGHVYIYTGTEPGYTAGHVYYYVDGVLKDGGVYGGTAVDATLTQSGKAADAAAVGAEVSAIKEDLSNYNSVNLLKNFATYTNRTSGGVTYTWDVSTNTCHAVGTSNAMSFTNLYVGAILPIGIKIGDKLWVKVLSTKAFNLFLEIMAYNEGTSLGNAVFRESGYYTVPENATAITIRVRTRYVTGEPSTVNDYITTEILNTKSNKELVDDINSIPLSLMQIFPKYTTIGDSLMCGFVNNNAVSVSSADAKLAGNNWPTYIAKRTGLEFTNVAVGGSTTAEWRATHIATANVDTNCYIIGLGINDLRQSLSVGTSADIKSDYTANADSFYGNYDYIVRQLMSWKSNAHIMCFAIPSIEPGNTDVYNSAIKYIASRYANKVHFVDLTEYANEYNDKLIVNNFVNGHFNPIAYNMMSGIIERAINTCIYNNYTLFLGAPYV